MMEMVIIIILLWLFRWQYRNHDSENAITMNIECLWWWQWCVDSLCCLWWQLWGSASNTAAVVYRCRSSHCPSHSMSLCGTIVLLLVLEGWRFVIERIIMTSSQGSDSSQVFSTGNPYRVLCLNGFCCSIYRADSPVDPWIAWGHWPGEQNGLNTGGLGGSGPPVGGAAENSVWWKTNGTNRYE